MMYAAVEFENDRSCSIVPITWICNDVCYWPSHNIKEKEFKSRISQFLPPLPNWKTYSIKKIHFTCEDQIEAEKQLDDIIKTTSESNASGYNNNEGLKRKEVVDEQSSGNHSENNEPIVSPAASLEELLPVSTDIENYKPEIIKNRSIRKRKTSSSSEEWSNNENRRKKMKNLHTRKRSPVINSRSSKSESTIQSSVNNATESQAYSAADYSSNNIESYHESMSEDDSSEHVKSKKKGSETKNSKAYSSSDSDGDWSLPPKRNKQDKIKIIKTRRDKSYKASHHEDPGTSSQSISKAVSTGSGKGTANASRGSSPSTPSSRARVPSPFTPLIRIPSSSASATRISLNVANNMSEMAYKEKVIKYLEKLTLVQEQLCQQVNKLSAQMNSQSVKSITKPEDFPELPLETKQDFKVMEKMLIDEKSSAYTYLKNRLSCIGGGTVRQATMNMLKFVLSNKIARKFNWAGHNEKRAFRDTNLMHLINQAVYLQFSSSGNKPSDLNDGVIIKAVQDWLRLAEQRHQHHSRQ